MALAELFGPNMPQLYGSSAQLLRDRPDCEDNLHEDMFFTLQFTRQVHVPLKLSNWQHGTVGKTAAMRCVQAAKARLRRAGGFCFRSMIGTDDSKT